jgi:hypothetical protein
VVALLVIELVVVVLLLILGVRVGELLTSAGPVIALTLALLNPTVQELGRRKPKLTVRATEADRSGFVAAPALRPWPIDVERIVSNEVAEARQTLDVPRSALSALVLRGIGDPLAVPPSAADHERAKQTFKEKLATYEADLRSWLADYQQASRVRADTFQLTLHLVSAESGAHGDAITVVLDLPGGAEVVDDLPEVAPPPDRPNYQPPLPQRRGEFGSIVDYRTLFSGADLVGSAPPVARRPKTWIAVDQGRRLEAAVGDVQAGRSVALGDPLLIRVVRPGRHELGWTIFSKSLRRAATGTLMLDLPDDPDGPDRPAFGRLDGILAFPDVPIVDDEFDDEDEGEDEEYAFGRKRVARREVRSADPPGAPSRVQTTDAAEAEHGDGGEQSDGDAHPLIRHIREISAWRDWQALGLDPAHDGPERVEVRPAEQIDTDEQSSP